MNLRKIKNAARNCLGEKAYWRISKILFPREITDHYGERLIAMEPAAINQMILQLLTSGEGASLAKIGATELRFCLEYTRRDKNNLRYSESLAYEMLVNSGIFPTDVETLQSFGATYIAACKHLSHLAVWYRPGESNYVLRYLPDSVLFRLNGLDPIQFGSNSWLQGLSGKRVLIVSPFTRSISEQYDQRHLVWSLCPGFLPNFEISFIKSPLSAGLVDPEHNSWNEALEDLKLRMDQLKYDVALVGAGAFSLPLVVHAHKKGAVGIHLGGQLQILFGVMGGRWETNDVLAKYINKYWIRPSGDEVPKQFKKMEGGCYW